MDIQDMSLSDMCQCEIRRTGDAAEIIIDYYHGDPEKPVRLLGFVTQSSKSDFEIFEEGYLYYRELLYYLKS